jgi:formylglycine-generating enzyme required for sulfatase activity
MFMAFGVGDVVQRLRHIHPGRFLMGSPESELGRWEDEGPQHVVELSEGYWLADTPCTQALWEAVMGQNPSAFVTPKNPVERVSWDDCQEFLRRLNEQVPGLHARLPSEAEWEYACRGGTSGATWMGELDGDVTARVLDSIAWYGGNSEGRTHPVGRKAANPFGLYDMLGNVLEWCQDVYGPYRAAAQVDPTGPTDGSKRVDRGGSWGSGAWLVRAACRDESSPDCRDNFLGFRLARGQESGQ